MEETALKSPKIAFAAPNMGFENSEEKDERSNGDDKPQRYGPAYELRELTSLLKFFGLIISKDTIFGWPPKDISQRRFVLRLLLHILGVLVLWANAMRVWVMFGIRPSSDTASDVVLRVSGGIFSLLCALNATICASRWYNIRGITSPYREFSTFLTSNQNVLSNITKEGFTAKICRVFFVCFVCFIFGNVALSGYVLFASDEKIEGIWIQPFSNTTPFKLLYMFLNVYQCVHFVAPSGYFLIFCLVALHQCNNLEKMMKTCLETNDLKQIPELRRIHCCICEEINKADDLFTYISLGAYTNLMPFACFLLYTFLFTSSDNLALHISMGGWTVSCIGVLGVYSFAGALLNTKIHSVITHLQKMSMRGLDLDTHAELMLFISKLNGQPIALTAGRIIVIDNSLITTVVGVVLTYFTLLYQIK